MAKSLLWSEISGSDIASNEYLNPHLSQQTTAAEENSSITTILKASKVFSDFLKATVLDLTVYLKEMDEQTPYSEIKAEKQQRDQLLKRKKTTVESKSETESEDEDEEDESIIDNVSYSGESEFSELHDDEDLPGYGVKKKNRPGQQARRKMWEEKYGNAANHIVQQKQKQPKPKPHYRESKSERIDNANVHPSWEAKRKLKQQQLVAQPQGKKIVFDD